MAAAFTLLSASPDALKYRWNYDGTGGAGSSSATRTRAQMIADCAGGPLKALLQASDTDPKWQALQGSAQLSMYTTMETFTAGTGVEGRINTFIGPGNGMQVNGVDGNAGVAFVEVRFHHTLTR